MKRLKDYIAIQYYNSDSFHFSYSAYERLFVDLLGENALYEEITEAEFIQILKKL